MVYLFCRSLRSSNHNSRVDWRRDGFLLVVCTEYMCCIHTIRRQCEERVVFTLARVRAHFVLLFGDGVG